MPTGMAEIAEAYPNNLVWFRIAKEIKEKNTLFEIQVVSSIEPSKPWSVQHRFSDFRDLHDKVSKFFTS